MTKDPFDQFWEWAEKPLDSMLTIDVEIHEAVMSLPPEDRHDREKVNEAVRDKQERQVSEMIERVARALAKADGDPAVLFDYYLEHARAAIEAMREPTKEMAAAGKHALETSARGARQLTDMGHSVMTFPHLAAWRAMIDQALVEH